MTNPFEDEAGKFLVLVNDEQQHSLWPAETLVPEGWTVTYGPDGRADCLQYVERAWSDMRPLSLRNAQR